MNIFVFPYDFLGLQIFEDAKMVDTLKKQFRFPRSRRRRIQKKWAKQDKNYRLLTKPSKHLYTDHKTFLVGHPETLRKIYQNVCKDIMGNADKRVWNILAKARGE